MDIHTIINYTCASINSTFRMLLFFCLPLIIMGLIMNFISSNLEIKISNLIGIRGYLFCFGWIGTIVHECGHALFCIIFRHKIEEIKFFNPDPETGTLGYVKHSYKPTSLYQNIGNFFIGIGPIISGSLIIMFITYFSGTHLFSLTVNTNTLSFIDIFTFFLSMIKALLNPQNFLNWRFYLFIYLCIAIGSSINLSMADIKSAIKGFIVILLFIFCVNLTLLWTGNINDFLLSKSLFFLNLFYSIMLFSIFINFVLLVIVPPFFKIIS